MVLDMPNGFGRLMSWTRSSTPCWPKLQSFTSWLGNFQSNMKMPAPPSFLASKCESGMTMIQRFGVIVKFVLLFYPAHLPFHAFSWWGLLLTWAQRLRQWRMSTTSSSLSRPRVSCRDLESHSSRILYSLCTENLITKKHLSNPPFFPD